MARYLPKKGDLITLTFDPQAGYKRKGRRPALVISNDLFNRHTGLIIVCPITNTQRSTPFHIALTPDVSVSGFVMVDQVKSIDFVARKAKFVEKIPEDLLDEALSILDACIY